MIKMRIKEMFKKYSKVLEPNLKEKDEIYMRVFGEMPNKNLSVIEIIMNSKFIKPSLAIAFIIAFIAIPLLPEALNNTDSVELSDFGLPPEEDALIDYGELGQNLDTYSNKAMAPSYGYEEDTTTLSMERAVEKDGTIAIEVNDVKETYDNILNLLNNYDGYVQSSSLGTAGDDRSRIIVRVPVDQFNDLFNDLRKVDGNIISESIQTTDMQNRLTQVGKLMEDYNTELINLNNELNTNITDKRRGEIETRIKWLTSEIKSLESEQKQIKSETEFSTIDITIAEKVSNSFFGNDFKDIGKFATTIFAFWFKVVIVLLIPAILLFAGYKLKLHKAVKLKG
ncbi:DUF4349 domain-containing protein [Candidatus Dojkabacteria bacterium]|uniref:DUF4349 domain-containing protein n=1 Tax=Candidatus Dojkabacteria bacterium TaxID=2099670 RepID=A0A955L186_9BACT|nr:DUF4349 domain-containing protein [Candidatus Dojkabacteria bacterium]